MLMATLGNTGIAVTRMCFGTLTVGPLQAKLPVEEGARVIAHAIERGINFFDTAQLYETYPYLRRGIELGGRRDIVIASKTYAYTAEMARDAVEEARRELDRDYIDIFMLHEQESVHTLQGHERALDYLFECKQRGIVRAVGASMHHIAAVYGAIKMNLDVIHPLINRRGLGIVDGSREEMEHALLAARERGLGSFGMKPLGGGNLFKEAEDCLHYIVGLSMLDSVAIGMQSPEEVDANIGFWETGSFTPEARTVLEARKRRLHIDSWCEGCGSCIRVCPQGALYPGADNKTQCMYERCILCGYCAPSCPILAIKVV